MAWTAPRTWTAGEIVTAAMGNTHWRDNLLDLADGSWGRDVTLIRKTADEALLNPTVMQNDDQLLFTAVASATYLVDIGLLVVVSGGSSGSDIKTGWSLPASAAFSGGGYGADVAMAGGSSSGVAEFFGVVGAVGSTISYGLFSTGVTFIRHSCTILMSTTAGTCNFQWAHNASVAGVTTTVKAGSWLKAERIA